MMVAVTNPSVTVPVQDPRGAPPLSGWFAVSTVPRQPRNKKLDATFFTPAGLKIRQRP